MLIKAILPIKLGQRRRLEFSRISFSHILSEVARDPTLPSPLGDWSLVDAVGC